MDVLSIIEKSISDFFSKTDCEAHKVIIEKKYYIYQANILILTKVLKRKKCIQAFVQYHI